MTGKPDDLVALERTEAAIGDVVALLSAYLDGDDVAEQAEVDQIMRAREGETAPEWSARIKRTIGLSGVLGATLLDLAAGLMTDPHPDSRELLQTYALRLTLGHQRRRAITCRCRPPSSGPWVIARCPLCLCVKSGALTVPNRVTHFCADGACVCHTYEEPLS